MQGGLWELEVPKRISSEEEVSTEEGRAGSQFVLVFVIMLCNKSPPTRQLKMGLTASRGKCRLGKRPNGGSNLRSGMSL